MPVTQPLYAQNTAGFTLGGPVKIPGIYKDTNRRTNFQVNYQGNRSNNVFDQYATVPTMAERNGDFSSSPVQLVDPSTGLPFANNQIPTSSMNQTALALLPFIPQPNLPGTSQNYHVSTLSHSSSDSVSLRFTQNLSATVPQNGGRGGRGGGFGGGGRGGPGGRGQARGTSIVLSAQLQYRHNEADTTNVFPGLGGNTTTTSIAAPMTLNITRGRNVNNFTVQLTHTSADSTNAFSGVQNVAGQAGIVYPTTASTDPLNWGVPNLSFSGGLTGVQGAGASSRTDDRLTTSYVWSRPIKRHQVRIGADYRLDSTTSEINGNARGTFTFSGIYSAPGSQLVNGTGASFADFLLGAPQSATLQSGGTTNLRGKAMDVYAEDNWQMSPKLTFNLGLRYELALPYTEVNGHLANLDVAPGFTAVSSVTPGSTGPFSGQFPAGLINADKNNIGPRIGLAYRIKPSTILRAGYSITYNPGRTRPSRGSWRPSRRLPQRRPWLLKWEPARCRSRNALVPASGLTTSTNNYGVEKNYQLGEIQTWNSMITKNLSAVWSVVLGYTGVKGSDIDLLEAPNRTPTGLLIPTVQPFTWESSDAHSILNSGNLQLNRRLAHGVSGSASLTVMKSMDDSPSLGGGNDGGAGSAEPRSGIRPVEFRSRPAVHRQSGTCETPGRVGRRWMTNGGFFSEVLGDWAASFTFTAQTGTPLTARVSGSASNIAQGVNGATRADYTGLPITLSSPAYASNGVPIFFNTAAFTTPAGDAFGDSSRNMIIGPGAHQLNATFVRDIRLGGARALTLNVNIVNLLSTVEWATVDTNVNSLTYGQVLSVRPLRSMTINARFRF